MATNPSCWRLCPTRCRSSTLRHCLSQQWSTPPRLFLSWEHRSTSPHLLFRPVLCITHLRLGVQAMRSLIFAAHMRGDGGNDGVWERGGRESLEERRRQSGQAFGRVWGRVDEDLITYIRMRSDSLSSHLYKRFYRDDWSYKLPLKMIAFFEAVDNSSRFYGVNGRGGWIAAVSMESMVEAAG